MAVPAKAFVSYSRADADFVLRLCQDLRNAGGAIWLDQLDIQPGEEWDQEIQRGLAECEQMVAVLSPKSVASQNVMDEIGYALSKKKRIFPVLYRDCEVPYRLNRLHYADFRTNYDEGLHDLLAALREPSVLVGAPTLGEAASATAGNQTPRASLRQGKYLGYLLAAAAVAAILAWTVLQPEPAREMQETKTVPAPEVKTTPIPQAPQPETTPPVDATVKPPSKDSLAPAKKAPSSFKDSFRAALRRYIAEAPSGFQKLGAEEFVDWTPSVKLAGAVQCRGSGYPREPVIECVLYRTNSEVEALNKFEELIELTEAVLPDWEPDRLNAYNAFFFNKEKTLLVSLGASQSAGRYDVALSVRRRN